MPESPEVTILTQYLHYKLHNKEIGSIHVMSGKYKRLNLIGINLIRRKHRYKITSIDSKGKFIWFELADTKTNEKVYILNTLGMTGRWSFFKSRSARLRFTIFDKKEKYNLYFIDQRNFGNVWIYSNDVKLIKHLNKLAPDILKGGLNDTDIIERINVFNKVSRKNKNLVMVLMDQSALVSGIGNYLVAEILYDAKLSPYRNIDDLSKADKKRLAHSMRKIVKESYYDNKTEYMEYLSEFMKKHPKRVDKQIFPNYHSDIKATREFKFKVYKKKKDSSSNGNPIRTDSIVKNRTIYWVPNVQK